MRYSFANGSTITYGKNIKVRLKHEPGNENKCRVTFTFQNDKKHIQEFSTPWYEPSQQEWDKFGDAVFDRVWENLLISLSLSTVNKEPSWFKNFLAYVRKAHFSAENFHGKFEEWNPKKKSNS